MRLEAYRRMETAFASCWRAVPLVREPVLMKTLSAEGNYIFHSIVQRVKREFNYQWYGECDAYPSL